MSDAAEVVELIIKLEYFKRNLIKALERLVEVKKERDELREEVERLKSKASL